MSSYLTFQKVESKSFFYIVDKNGLVMIDSKRKTIQLFETKKEAELRLKKFLIEQLRYGVYTFEGQTYRAKYSISKEYQPLTSEIRAKIVAERLLNFEILELKEEVEK